MKTCPIPRGYVFRTRSCLRTLKVASILCLVLPGWCGSSALAASGILTGLSQDAQVSQLSGVNSVTGQTTAYLNVGAYFNTTRLGVVHVFEIPSTILSDATQQFTAASFTATRGVAAPAGYTPAFNGDLYGVGSGSSPTVLASDFYAGAFDASSVLIQDNFLVPSLPYSTAVTTSAGVLAAYLNGELAAARAEGAGSLYVFFRINPDTVPATGAYYLVGMKEAGSAAPALAYTTAAVSGWSQVPIGGGGFVTGLVGDSSGADLYARTDVGGLYKRDFANGAWTHLTDKIAPTTSAHWLYRGLSGVTSVAIDPSDSNILYAALGSGASDSVNITDSNMGIYRSTDKGGSWVEITNSSFAAFNIHGGRSEGKALGERLAVDPNNPNLVWYGSERHGVIKGVLSAGVWTWTQVAATAVPFGTAHYGISFVMCDANGGSTITYAGVYDNAGSTGGVYKTVNGVDWAPVSSVALGMPCRATLATAGANAGTLYVTGNGAVFKLTRAGVAANITPASGKNYRGVATSPDGVFVHVAENAGSATCPIWRSTDGGAPGSWKTQASSYYNNRSFQYTAGVPPILPAEPDGTPSTLGGNFISFAAVSALWLNPANPSELWTADLYRVQRTLQADKIGNTALDTQPLWHTMEKNFEELFIFDIKNSPAADGVQVMAGFADMGGGRHFNIDRRPVTEGSVVYGSLFSNPKSKDVTSLDFSEGTPNFWVRTYTQRGVTGTGGYSLDGGASWLRFGQIARKTVTNDSAGGWETWDLTHYLSKLRARGVITATFLVCADPVRTLPTGAAPEDTLVFESNNTTNGSTLRPQLVLNGSPVAPQADTYVAWQNGNATTLATNYGTAPELVHSNGGTLRRWSFIRFDLSGAVSITSAQLRLYRRATTANTRAFTAGIHACANTTWIEGNGGADNSPADELTWNNKPAPVSEAGGDPFREDAPYFAHGSRSLNGGRIAVSATNPNLIVWEPVDYATQYTKDMLIVSSDDRGVTWTDNTSGLYSQVAGTYTNGSFLKPQGKNLAADRVDGSFYYAIFGGTHQFYRSTDGKSWTAKTSISAGSGNIFTPQMVAAPAAGHLWVCDDSDYSVTHSGGGLWKSTDGATGWTKITTFNQTSQVAFGAPPSGSAYLYSVFALGIKDGLRKVYRSDDYGSTWVALADIPTLTEVCSMAGDRKIHGRVYLGTLGRGLFVGR